ncbi:MAG: acyl carrier protein [Bacteroidales bacterium]|nr:acyl carrier protein [Bacteroidales bacterium]MBQ3594782.1 acyl carrier protein [Bacteroidales bacterium]
MMETREQIIDIIVNKLGANREDVIDSASFTNDLGADSLDTVELIMAFEEQFEIQIQDNQAEKINTVGDAISFVEEALKNK